MEKKGWRNAASRWGLALVLAAAPLLAMAQGAPDTQDTAFTKALGPVFGDVFGGGGGGAALDGGVGSLFQSLNAAALLIAAIVLAYTMVAGTMATAHDGAMLGKRWSSMWIPVRTAFGIGMIIPLSSGFCAAQLAVFWLVGQGVGLASGGWQTYAENNLSQESTISVPHATGAVYNARHLLDSMICVERTNLSMGDSTAASAVGAMGAGGRLTIDGGTRYYGYLDPAVGPKDVCGVMPAPSVNVNQDGPAGEISRTVGEAHISASMTLEAEMQALAREVVRARAPIDPYPRVAAAAAAYMRTVNDAAQGAVRAVNSDQQRAENSKGFIYAGFRYISSMTAGNAAAGAVAATPKAKAADFTNSTGAMSADVKAAMATNYNWFERGLLKANEMGHAVRDAAGNALVAVNDFGNTVVNTGKMAFAGEISIEKLITAFSSSLLDSVITQFKGAEGSNPYASGIQFGHLIMATVTSIVVPLAAISFMTGMFSAGFWASPGGMIFSGLLGAAYAAGATLTILALVPAMAWLAFIGGWLLLVAEAVIAAPLWMVAHLNPESEGATGKGSDGYLLLTGVVLRPIIGLIALALSFSVGTVLCNLLDEFFGPLMIGSAGDSMVGLGVLVTMIFAYVTAKTTILVKSFAILNILPDAVMRWIGGGAAHGGLIGASDAISHGVDKSDAAGTGAMMAGLQGMRNMGGANGGRENGKDKNGDELKPDVDSPIAERTGGPKHPT